MENLSLIVFQVTNGAIWGLIVALLAVGLNLVYGLLGIVNVAQGALYMIGAYLTWMAWTYFGSFWIGALMAPLTAGLIAVAVERLIIRPVEHDHDLTIIMTIGISLVLEQSALAIFGGDVRSVEAPVSFSISVMDIPYPGYRIVVAAMAMLALFGLWLFLNRTRFGLWIRAVRVNPSIAQALGIPTERIFAVTFGIGSALAALGGALASPIVTVRPEMGADIIAVVFVVVIVGGLGNIFGSAVVAIVMAISEGIASVYATPTVARVASLVVMAIVVLRWPNGISLRKGAR